MHCVSTSVHRSIYPLRFSLVISTSKMCSCYTLVCHNWALWLPNNNLPSAICHKNFGLGATRSSLHSKLYNFIAVLHAVPALLFQSQNLLNLNNFCFLFENVKFSSLKKKKIFKNSQDIQSELLVHLSNPALSWSVQTTDLDSHWKHEDQIFSILFLK